jgi:prepilin-type N-terminal cleavage/methylation domain-containing protein
MFTRAAHCRSTCSRWERERPRERKLRHRFGEIEARGNARPPAEAARGPRGFTLVEFMVASALGLLALTAVALLSSFTTRSFVAATNYTDLAMMSRKGLDYMTRTIRQGKQVTAYSTNSISLVDGMGNSNTFTFDPVARTLVTVSGGQTTTNLTSCDSLEFWLYQRTPKSNTFDCYSPSFITNAKLVQVTWSCSRTILGAKVNTETIESAKITLRNH